MLCDACCYSGSDSLIAAAGYRCPLCEHLLGFLPRHVQDDTCITPYIQRGSPQTMSLHSPPETSVKIHDFSTMTTTDETATNLPTITACKNKHPNG